MKNGKIAFIGGDKRMFCCAEALSEMGFECALYGFDRISDRANSTRTPSIRDCLLNAQALVLPVPLSRDGISISCDGVGITLAEVLAAVEAETPIFAGAVSEKATAVAKQYNRTITDFLLDESLCEKNAYLTAEGAVGLAMRSIDGAVFGKRALVTGYGRIAAYTARLLKALGADVTVFARREISRTKACLDGHKAIGQKGLCDAISNTDIVFNTVPAIIFGEAEAAHFSSRQVYIELASSPFGIDKALADRHNLEITDGSSLPSRYCPVAAGGYIAEYLAKQFEGMGII